MLRAALYCRVSTDEQALNGDSLRTQLDALTRYAVKNDYQIIDKYIDDGYTGTNLNRPHLQRLLSDIKEHKIDIVLITKLDRWGRGVSNYYKVNDILEKNNVYWKTIFEDYDTSTTNGKLLVNIMLSIAENECRVTSDRIKVVFKNKILSNEVVTGKVPFGYKIRNKKLIIDENNSKIVKYAFDKLLEEKNLGKVYKLVKEYYNISYNGFKKWFRNEMYLGQYTCERLNVTVNTYCPSIIDLETYNKVQEIINKKDLLLDKKKKRTRIAKIAPNSNKKMSYNIFAHLVYNDSNNEEIIPVRKKTNDKFEYRYYPNSESSMFLTESYIENKLIKLLIKSIDDFNIETSTRNKIIQISPEFETEQLNNKLQLLKQMYLDELITYPEYQKEFNKYNKMLEQAKKLAKEKEDALLMNDESNIYEFTKQISDKLNDQYYKFTVEEKNTFWINVLDKIYIDNNFNVSFEFNKGEIIETD